ncbi:MAG: GDSL-type esterase/lipase family protein [Bacteroidales bacterium]|nr:GDSL-type esterase/lipase family protein [Bacteroidales bacterium]
MKSYKILLFIFSVIALLALLCSFFPEDGIVIGPFGEADVSESPLRLQFPSLERVFEADAPAEEMEDPEILIQKRMESISNARRNQFFDYFENDPARFYFPGDSITLFDSLFYAFENSGEEPLRVVHYGDSQIEIDRVTAALRAALQSRFGGRGPGAQMIGHQLYNYSISQSTSRELPRRMAYGPATARAGHNGYGPLAQMSRLDSSVIVSYNPRKDNDNPSATFNRLTVMAGNIRGRLRVTVGGNTLVVTPDSLKGKRIAFMEFELADSARACSMTLSGSADLYGALLDGSEGISVDNVPMRGCSGTIFTRVNADHFREYFEKTNTRLIILQYGGNTVPYMNASKQISDYGKNIEKQINYLRTLAPDAYFLFIGPSDMSTRIQGKMQTYPKLPMLVDTLRTYSNKAGAVFWDMYGAMGGHGSMARWATSQPPLAGSDHVHFTKLGADKMGDMLTKSLLLYYDYYKLRREDHAELQRYMDSLDVKTLPVGKAE